MPDIFDQYSHSRPTTNPMIYAYQDHIPEHRGLLKVGYTSKDVDARVAQQFPTMTPDKKKPYEILVRESALYPDGNSFTDHDVHRMLVAKGIQRMGKSEWFRCTPQDVMAAIVALKTNNTNLDTQRTNTFKMRPEQEYAVKLTKAYFEKEKDATHHPKFLWNAKMRFGKTFATYELAKAMGMKRVLILTFKPAVEAAWEEDLMTHVDFDGWQFYSREHATQQGITPDDLDQARPIVCFGSFQDYLGTNENGGIKAKNEWVHTTNWDMVVFDEYHYGAWRDKAKDLFEKPDEDSYDTLDIEKYKKTEADNAYNESFLPITSNYYLYLSGTPFRALNSGEFMEDQIFSWTYSDEQREKRSWDNSKGPNPYEALPQMVLMTYKMPDAIRKVAYNSDTNEFDLNLFFSAKCASKNDLDSAEFVYRSYVQKWLDLIRGAYLPTTLDELKMTQNQRPVLPYSDARLLRALIHTFWFLPNVASCYAMAHLLAEPQNKFYHDYTVNICAGTAAGIGLDALKPVRESMDPPLETKTITLSCGKLTTGVTVKPWSGIFMLRNLSSPETYFQAAFRVQSPWTVKNEDGSSVIMKRECYIFDFALDRALKQVADYSCRLNIEESNQEKKVGEFINFLPVLAYDGATMKPVSASEILDLAMSGTSATLLARRWESAMLVNVDNETLQRLMNNPEAMAALMKIEGFRSLNQDIEIIINKSEAVKKAKKKGEALSPKEKQEMSEEEKEYKSRRKQIQEKLIKFATRIPIFMFLTDFREYSLKDVITQFEPGLFKKVTGLEVKDFNLLISLGLFNDSIMNEAIYTFKRYEDSSLEYTGIRKHALDENVGLFSTVISREDYEQMAAQQRDSMVSTTQYMPIAEKILAATQAKTVTPQKPKVQNTSSIPPKTGKVEATQKPISFTQKDSSEAIESKVTEIPKITIGDKVKHKKFGVGTVTDFNGTVMDVRFDEGQKRLGYPFVFENNIIEKL
ncbi:GIY-YIG nuclease family protein [Gemmiger formicilis]|uniref:GIY-YIG nuclease family protein n=1 Tax=Gemmiger formicilis TaxID=745368 RepID=UPI00195DD7F1|nr:GIY-YIG nuclease family protein [Gemmiger formicilis]